jgi:flavorubredoxin
MTAVDTTQPALIAAAVPAFPREISDGVFWFAACNESRTPRGTMHTHNSCYLVVGRTASVLIDNTLPHGWSELKRHLASILGDRSLNYLFPTHPELPHMGNTEPLLETYPNAQVVGDTRNYHLFFPGAEHRFLRRRAGDELDLGGRRIRFVSPVVYDLPNTLWGYEPDAQILFVSDAYPFAHNHREGECAMMSNELRQPPMPEDTAGVLGGALGWTRHVDAELTIGDLDRFLRAHPTRVIAPAHGGVSINPPETTEIFKNGLRDIRKTKDV